MEKVQENDIKFDIIRLLKETQLDTKPNVAKFLQNHVRDIRAVISNGKIQCWPTYKYQISKVFVTFLDGHELIFYVTQVIPNIPKYYLYYNMDEIELKQCNVQFVEAFFNALLQFKFVPSQQDDSEAFHQSQSSLVET